MINLTGELLTTGFFYLIIFIYLYGLAFVEICCREFRYKKFIFLTSVILLTLVLALRWETGTDWDPYKQLFETVEFDANFILNVYGFDIGYVFLNSLVRVFTDNYTIFLVINSSIGMYLIYNFVNKTSPLPNLSLFIFYSTYFIAHFMGSNRRLIAIGAVLNGFYYLLPIVKKKFSYFLTLAFLFHRTSFVSLGALAIPINIISTRKIFVTLILSLGLGVSQIPFELIGISAQHLSQFIDNSIVDKMAYYFVTSNEHVPDRVDVAIQTTLAVIKRGIFLIFFLYIRKSVKCFDSQTNFFLNIYIVGFSSYLLLAGSPIFQILTTYFAAIEIALTARVLMLANKEIRLGSLAFLFCYGILQILSSLNSYPELYMPYKSVL